MTKAERNEIEKWAESATDEELEKRILQLRFQLSRQSG